MKILGFTITREKEDNRESIALPEPKHQDGAMEVYGGYGSSYMYSATFDYAIPEDENLLITKYRELALQPEFDRAIDDIVNEIFAYDPIQPPVKLNLTKIDKLSQSVKDKMSEEFNTVLNLLNFKEDAYDIFRRWYVDGRLYYQKLLFDDKHLKKGMKELRYIDPRKIRKVRKRSVKKPKIVEGIEVGLHEEEFYIYNPAGISHSNPQGIKITKDSIAYIHSGLFSKDNKTVLSYLHKAIKFYNMLRQLEDALVIYRLVRAPERRIFNIEVGDLPPRAADKYLEDEIKRFRKKLSFDPVTGEVNENKRYLTMLEDFWFPQRNGRGTTIDTLPGGQTLGELDDVDYFKKKLYEALNVPFSRLDTENSFMSGRSGEISREELKFTMFIVRLRKRFNGLFNDLLKTQLTLKKIMTAEDWDTISEDITYDYNSNNFFTELKWTEIWQTRFSMLNDAERSVGKFFSKRWIQEQILHLTDEEIKELDEQIAKEREEAKKQGRMYGDEDFSQSQDPQEGQDGEDQPEGDYDYPPDHNRDEEPIVVDDDEENVN